jgi:hypothetical protein
MDATTGSAKELSNSVKFCKKINMADKTVPTGPGVCGQIPWKIVNFSVLFDH